jgi:hypothetical protein
MEHTYNGGWMLSSVLLTIGAVAAALAILLALWGAFDNPGEAASAALVAAATPIALGALAFGVIGGVLRYSCSWGDCDWDDEDDRSSATTAP